MSRLKHRLSYLLLGQQGGENRIKIIDLLRERPFNINQLANKLDLNYRTVKHHVNVLIDNDLLTTSGEGEYGEVYFLSSKLESKISLYDDIKLKRRDMQTSTELYQKVLTQIHNGIIIVDEDKDVIFINENGENIIGYSKKDVLGRSIDIFKEDGFLDKNIEKISEGGVVAGVETEAITKSGEEIYLRVTLDRIEDEEIDILGYSLIFEDITLQKEQREDLIKSEERLRRSQRVADVGTWEIDLESWDINWSEQTYRIFGITVGEELDYDKFLELVHPKDRDRVDERWKEGLEKGEYDVDHRIIVDDEVRWVREKAEIIFNEDGEPEDVIGSVQDITERKKYQERIEFLSSLIESIKDVNQQLVKNDDFNDVLDKVPSILLGTKGFTNITLAMLNNEGVIQPISNAGSHEVGDWTLTREGEGNNVPGCVKEAVSEGREVIVEDKGPFCEGCPVSHDIPDHQTVVVPMKQNGSVVGVIRACYEPDIDIDEETLELLREVSGDLVFAMETKDS